MSVTIIGGTSPSVRDEATPLVEIKASWSDGWALNTELIPIRASWHSGHDVGSLTFMRRYGPTVYDVHDDAFETRARISIRGSWVRLRLLGDAGLQTIWQGRIESELREVRLRSQKWVAYGPQNQLRKIDVHHCHWYHDASVIELGRVPSMNLAGPEGLLVGNCSTTRQGTTYVYYRRTDGALTSLWSHYDYLEYILERFVNGTGRPTWTIGGQTSILRNLDTYIELTGRESAMDLLTKLIPPKYGVDYVIVPTGGGYEVRIFALTAVGTVFAGADIPLNPNLTRVEAVAGSGAHDVVTCVIEHSSAQEYDHIRIVGERKRTQFTLSPWILGDDVRTLWTNDQETAYKEGTGTPSDSADLHDNARRDDRFRNVFKALGTVIAFDFGSGQFLPPLLDLAGAEVPGTPAQQIVEKSTLPDLLTREGWDYTVAIPVPKGVTGAEAAFLPPLAILYNDQDEHPLHDLWVLLDKATAMAKDTGWEFMVKSIEALEHDWGLRIDVEPNHALASKHWADEAASRFNPLTDAFDYEDIACTIAIETDHRLEIGYDVSPEFASGDGSTLVIEAPDCHYWYLAPNTYLGVTADGYPIQSYSGGLVLRNDVARMIYLAAGAIARYCYGRSRCRLVNKKLEAWTELVGTILAVVEDEGGIEPLDIPITSVEWNFTPSDRSTVIRAGYAR